MQLSKYTIDALKNLASINPQILITPTEGEGTVLRTFSPQSNLVGILSVPEKFTDELPLYDLNQFLAVVTSLESPSLEVDPGVSVTIKSGKSKSKIFFADKSMIKTTKKDFSVTNPTVNFVLKNDDLQKLLKMASVLQLPDFVVTASNGEIKIEITDTKNTSSSSFDVVVSDSYTGSDYKFYIKSELLKFIPGDYDVNILEKTVAEFVSQDKARKYYVALETK